MKDSAAPDSVEMNPEPFQFGTYLSRAVPNRETRPTGCSVKVRISGSVVPESLMSARPDSATDALTLPNPTNSKRPVRSSGLAVLDSAAPESTEIEPEPFQFGTYLSAAEPEIEIRILLSSTTLADSTAPLIAKRSPLPSYALVTFSETIPLIENRICLSSGLNDADSAAPEKVPILI